MYVTLRRRASALLVVLGVLFLGLAIYFAALGAYVVAALAGLATLIGLLAARMVRGAGRNGPAPALTLAYAATMAAFLIVLWRTLSATG